MPSIAAHCGVRPHSGKIVEYSLSEEDRSRRVSIKQLDNFAYFRQGEAMEFRSFYLNKWRSK